MTQPAVSPSPAATPSLAEQLDQLQQENQLLRQQFHDQRTQAEYNYAIICRHQAFDLEVISTNNFPDLLGSIFRTLPQLSDLDVVSLSLLDEDADIHTVMANLGVDLDSFPGLVFVDSKADLSAVFLPSQENQDQDEEREPILQPLLTGFDPSRYSRQFPACLVQPTSIAIVPLVRNRKLIGTLNMGSLDESRFHSELGTDFIEHMASIISICLENVISNELLKYIGLTDALTGVYNRRYIDRRLLEEIAHARRHGHSLSCLYLDIDNFKNINDTLGHLAGDDVLREIATRIKAELRQSDTLARFGGEEFVTLLSEADLANAIMVAERIRAGIADLPFEIAHANPIHVTASIGVATLTATDRSEAIEPIALQLLAKADHALYEAKEGGRNRVISFDQASAMV
jgi:diguanylate cyclase (GGDEF)-like protein